MRKVKVAGGWPVWVRFRREKETGREKKRGQWLRGEAAKRPRVLWKVVLASGCSGWTWRKKGGEEENCEDT